MSDELTEIKSEVNLDSSEADSEVSSHIQIDDILKSLSAINSSPQSNSAPKIEIVPEVIKFKHTYPNVPVTKQIQIINKGNVLEHFSISVSGDKAFNSSTREVDVRPSSTYPLYISFMPKKVMNYNASLIVEGRKSMALPLIGSCVEHPLGFPSPEDSVWSFSHQPQTHKILFSNSSTTDEIKLQLSTNSPLFSFSSSEISIKPAKTKTVSLSFEPDSSFIGATPSVKLVSKPFGIFVTIPLKVSSQKESKTLNFGTAIVGKQLFQEIPTESQYKEPELKPPFSFEKHFSDESLCVLCFSSKEPGTYSATIELCGRRYILVATSIPVPYDITIQRKLAKDPFKFKNTTNETVEYTITPKSIYYILEDNVFTLKPGKSKILKLDESQLTTSIPPPISLTQNDDQTIELEIICRFKNKTLTDIFNFPIYCNPLFLGETYSSEFNSNFYSSSANNTTNSILLNRKVNPNSIRQKSIENQPAYIYNAQDKTASTINSSSITSPIKDSHLRKPALHNEDDSALYSTSSNNDDAQQNSYYSSSYITSAKQKYDSSSQPPRQNRKENRYTSSSALDTSGISPKNKTQQVPRNTKRPNKSSAPENNDGNSFTKTEDNSILTRLSSFQATTSISPLKNENSQSLHSLKPPVCYSLSEKAGKQIKCSFISFPQVSPNEEKTYQILLDCFADFELDVPSWIKLDPYQELQNSIPITLHCSYDSFKKLPNNVHEIYSTMIIRQTSNPYNQQIEIPVFAYEGASNLVFSEYITVNRNRASFKVKNIGTRTAFLCLSTQDELPFEINVMASAKVIKPDEVQSFDFIVSDKCPTDFNIPIAIHYGDEIIRQIRTFYQRTAGKVDQYFSLVFQNIQTESEIDFISPFIHLFKQSSINVLFKKLMHKSVVHLVKGKEAPKQKMEMWGNSQQSTNTVTQQQNEESAKAGQFISDAILNSQKQDELIMSSSAARRKKELISSSHDDQKLTSAASTKTNQNQLMSSQQPNDQQLSSTASRGTRISLPPGERTSNKTQSASHAQKESIYNSSSSRRIESETLLTSQHQNEQALSSVSASSKAVRNTASAYSSHQINDQSANSTASTKKTNSVHSEQKLSSNQEKDSISEDASQASSRKGILTNQTNKDIQRPITDIDSEYSYYTSEIEAKEREKESIRAKQNKRNKYKDDFSSGSYSEEPMNQRAHQTESTYTYTSSLASETEPPPFDVDKDSLDFGFLLKGENQTIDITISNETDHELKLSIRPQNPQMKSNAFTYPSSLKVRRNGTAKLPVEFNAYASKVFKDAITISAGTSYSFDVTLYAGCFVEKETEIEFPVTTAGVTRHSNVKVTNRCKNKITVLVEAPEPFHSPFAEFTVDPMSYVLCPIDFTPEQPGKYEGVAIIKSELGTLTRIYLTGVCYE